MHSLSYFILQVLKIKVILNTDIEYTQNGRLNYTEGLT